MKYQVPGITANGIAGKYMEWGVLKRERLSHTKSVVIYKRRYYSDLFDSGPQFKVQVFNNTGEVWREFEEIDKLKDFIEEVKKMFLYKGRLYTKKEFYREVVRNTNIKYSEDIRVEAINKVLLGESTSSVSKKMKISQISIMSWLHKNGFIFERKYPNSSFYGKWVRKI